jgi:hypothetical protein
VAKLTLDFLPPLEPNIVKLHVFESPAKDGSFAEITTTTVVGTYPDYITRFTVLNANSATDWFAIAWEDANGVQTEMSQPIQGGTTTLVQILIDRVLLRDPALNENIVAQEAEGAISEQFNVQDPTTVDPAVNPHILTGLTYMVLARVYISSIVAAVQANKWVAGIVSMDSSASNKISWANIDKLIALANKELGRNFSVILLLKEQKVAGGLLQIVSEDVTRSLIEVE